MAPTLVWGVVAHTFPFLPPLAAPTPTEKNLGKDPLAQGRRAGVGRGRGSAVVPPTLSKLGQVELRRGDGVEGGGVCGTAGQSVPPAYRLWSLVVSGQERTIKINRPDI